MSAPATTPAAAPVAPLTCSLCSAAFASRNALFAHLRADHAVAQRDDESSGFDRDRAAGEARAKFESPALQAYYGAQPGIPAAAWAEAWRLFHTPLPVTFRLNASSRTLGSAWAAVPALARLVGLAPEDGIAAADAFAHRASNTAMRVCRRSPRTWEARPRQLLSDLQECGVVHRQELASAIPAELLGVDSSMAVLDMCSAPGSKTLQVGGRRRKRRKRRKRRGRTSLDSVQQWRAAVVCCSWRAAVGVLQLACCSGVL